VVGVTKEHATLAMRFSDRTLRKFGPYRRRCTYVMCQAAQGIMTAVPVKVHGLPPAVLTETSCIANDANWCQWDITWKVEPSTGGRGRFGTGGLGSTEGPSPDGQASAILADRIDKIFPSPPPASKSLSDETPQPEPPLARSSAVKHSQPGTPPQDAKGDSRGYLWGALATVLTAMVLRLAYPAMSLAEGFLAGVIPVLIAGTWI